MPTTPPTATQGTSFETQTGAFYAQAIRIFESPVPLVAAVHGAAIGAGFGLALACDVCVTGRDGWFQANFVRLGIHPGFALSTTLPTAVGRGMATDLLLTGRRIHAKEARRIGISQLLVPAGDELEGALGVAATIAGGAPRRWPRRGPRFVRGSSTPHGRPCATSSPSRANWPARPTPSKG